MGPSEVKLNQNSLRIDMKTPLFCASQPWPLNSKPFTFKTYTDDLKLRDEKKL